VVDFEKYVLDNGLKVLLNVDRNTPLAAFNMMYNAGSKNENENKTGLAHLFEHLMFSGFENVDSFDFFTQMAGAENNAFTNNDVTDFYITIPSVNLETAFWLESERMQNIRLKPRQFSNEKKIVIEEFKETVLNIPYGDVWHHISEMSFKNHPYNWPTIGKSIEHIKSIEIGDVMDFYNNFYNPKNAILSISGNVDPLKIEEMAQKWFGCISKNGNSSSKLIPVEPPQSGLNERVLTDDVPSNAIYLAFHVSGRKDKEFYTHDMISDILGRGRSSRLYQKLVKENEYFTELHCYITGSMDPGLLIIEGMVSDKTKVSVAEKSLFDELERLKTVGVEEQELQKLKNKVENQITFEEAGILNKAINLAQFELLGDSSSINSQIDLYRQVGPEMVMEEVDNIFKHSNCSKLIYLKK
jgi:predicted Zn-dependent peptidase